MAGDREAHGSVIDDADLVSGLTPDAVAGYATAGLFVIVSLPRRQALTGKGDDIFVDPAWARASDLVLDIRRAIFFDVDGSDETRRG